MSDQQTSSAQGHRVPPRGVDPTPSIRWGLLVVVLYALIVTWNTGVTNS